MLLEKLKAGKRNSKTIKFPGTDQDIIITVLSDAEMQDAALAAEKLFKDRDVDITLHTLDAFEDEKTLQILFRSLKSPEDQKQSIASSADKFRKLITTQEKDILVDEYKAFEMECSPNINVIAEEEFNSIISDLKKRPEEIAGNVSNTITAKKLIVYLAEQLQNLQKASGSTSS